VYRICKIRKHLVDYEQSKIIYLVIRDHKEYKNEHSFLWVPFLFLQAWGLLVGYCDTNGIIFFPIGKCIKNGRTYSDICLG